MPLRLLNPPKKKAYETEPCKTSEKWRGRPQQEPYDELDVVQPAVRVIDVLGDIRLQDARTPYDATKPSFVTGRYFEPDARVVGVWNTGSGPAGRYTTRSDIDIWIQIKGLTSTGEKSADQDIVEYLDRNEITAFAGGKERRIDVVIFDYPPNKEYCKIELTQEEDVQREIERFNSVKG